MIATFQILGAGAATVGTIGLSAALFAFFLGRFVSGRSARRAAANADSAPDGAGRGFSADRCIDVSAQERRCHFRQSGKPTQVAIGHPEDPCELARGVVVDRSSGGLGVELATPLAVGAIVSVRPSIGTDTAIGTWLEVEVRSCRRLNDSWHVGLKFVRTPPLSALWMLG